MATELSIIVVSYNIKPHLEQCLFSLQRALQGIAAEIIVVDNASSDGTASWLETAFPGIISLPQTENLGYSRANNLGMERASGKYILFLNPDTLLGENCLSTSLAFMNEHPGAGAIGLRMIDGFGCFLRESKRGWPGSLASLNKFLGMADRFPSHKTFSAYYAGNIPDRETHEVPVLSGAFMLVRKEALDKTGGFDERFFMYGEDIDLSCRIWQHGWKNYYLGDEAIVHFKGQSTDKGSTGYREHFYGAMSLFVRKYYRGSLSFVYRPLLLAGIGLQKTRSRMMARPATVSPNKEEARNYVLVGSGKDIQTFLERLDDKGAGCALFDTQKVPLAELGRHLGPGGYSEVLFCTGDLAFEEAIGWMDATQAKVPCYFHHAGSGSVAGPSKGWPGPLRHGVTG